MKMRIALLAMMASSAAAAMAAPAGTPMPGEPVKADPTFFKVGGKTGHPLDNLPANVRQLSAFGERPIISPDGKKVAFIGKAMGDAFEIDLATGQIRNLTDHMPHNGWTRIHYLKDGSYVLIGTRNPSEKWQDTRHERLELFWMDAGAQGPALPLGAPIFEGVATSRYSNKIAWAALDVRKGPALAKGSEGSVTLYVADVEVVDGRPKLTHRKAIRSADWSKGIFEAQDFLAKDEAVLVPSYAMKPDGKFRTDIESVSISTGAVTKYSVPENQYAEIEGIFPDGKRAMVECSNDTHEGLELCVLELKADNPRYTRLTRVLEYGNYRFANPTVAPDGTTIVFHFAHASDDYGAGRGILLMTGAK